MSYNGHLFCSVLASSIVSWIATHRHPHIATQNKLFLFMLSSWLVRSVGMIYLEFISKIITNVYEFQI